MTDGSRITREYRVASQVRIKIWHVREVGDEASTSIASLPSGGAQPDVPGRSLKAGGVLIA